MADNFPIKTDATTTVGSVATDEISYSSDTVQVQLVRLVHVSGSEGSKTLSEICDTTGLNVHVAPATSGGLSNGHRVATASTNAVNFKASAGQLYNVDVYNNADYPVYVKFHDNAGTPTAGAGIIRTVGVQAGTQHTINIPSGLVFSSGIAITIVKDLADAGTTAVAASDCVVDIAYK